MITFCPGNEDHSLDQAGKSKDLKRKEQEQHSLLLHELKPCALQALHELVALVHDRVNASDQNQPVLSNSTNGLMCSKTNEQDKTLTTEIFHLEEDPVAKILWILEPGIFKDIFLAMAVSLQSPISIVTLSLCT